MKRATLALSFALAVPTMMACSESPNDSFSGPVTQDSVDPTSIAGRRMNAYQHVNDPNSGDNGLLSPQDLHAQDQQVEQ